ncbi:MAG: MBL fold metallo-hydrolase [Cyclobacteriaceae bacterium]
MRSLLIATLLLLSVFCYADYLRAYKNTSLRKNAKSGSEKVIGGELHAGDLLEMLNDGQQTNGYYKTRIQGTSIEGWIYRSLVKRISGDLPTFMTDFEGVEVTIVDVGAGLGSIIKTPSGKYIIYDGGNGNHVHTFLKSIYDLGSDVQMIIGSHTDSDHWGAIKEIARDYSVKQALITSYRPDGLPATVSDGIAELNKQEGIQFRDLASKAIAPGTLIYQEDGFGLRFISGFGQRDDVFAKELGTNASKLRNAASIVIRLEYQDRAILFTGDAVGLEECKKSDCDCDYDCISTEKFMLDSASQFLESDVIIASHHGARNASCPDFIEAVNPDYVIFPSGNKHKHPHHITAMNYQSFGGVPASNIFRTDVGSIPSDTDSNECNNEWVGSNAGQTSSDGSFDDHIRIQISNRDRLIVGYLN